MRSRRRLIASLGVVTVALTGVIACQPQGSISQLNAAFSTSTRNGSIHVAGWAWDQDSAHAAIPVTVSIDGRPAVVMAGLPRLDVAALKGAAGPNHGFSYTATVTVGSHRVCVTADNLARTPGTNQLLGCRTVTALPADPLSSSASWLATVNYYRAGSGLDPVTENSAWAAGIAAHLRYMSLTPSSYFVGEYQSLHTENPASPYYTPAGAEQAGASDLVEGYLPSLAQRRIVEGWMTAPFHAIGVLRPGLTQSAFAASSTGAGLNVISGLTGPGTITSPIVFPGNGEVVGLDSFSGESPDPREACRGGAGGWSGLPLIAMLADNPTSVPPAVMSLNGGSILSSSNNTLCVIDSANYTTSDPVYGPTGRAILQGDHAVFIFARNPLAPGLWHAILGSGSSGVSWVFYVVPHS